MNQRANEKWIWRTLPLAIAAFSVATVVPSLVRSQEPADKAKNVEINPKAKVSPPEVPEPRSPHKAVYAQEYYHSFKDDRNISPVFHWHGLEPQGCVEFEPGGLRISLPLGYPGKRMGTGIGVNTTVTGDFEVTMRYEMLEEPKAADAGQGTGLFLWVDLNKPKLNRGFVSRGVRDDKQFVTWFCLTPDAPAKKIEMLKRFSANEKSGRMRIVRTGLELYYYVAEGAGEKFRLLQNHPFGAEDLQAIRWGGQTGGPQASLEARFLDLRIRADGLPDLPDVVNIGPVAPQGAAAETGLTLGGLAWRVGIGVAILLMSAVVVALVVRRRYSAPALVSEPLNEPQPVALSVAFPCPNCGKRMKVRPEAMGKKAKCPQCGQAALVPTNEWRSSVE